MNVLKILKKIFVSILRFICPLTKLRSYFFFENCYVHNTIFVYLFDCNNNRFSFTCPSACQLEVSTVDAACSTSGWSGAIYFYDIRFRYLSYCSLLEIWNTPASCRHTIDTDTSVLLCVIDIFTWKISLGSTNVHRCPSCFYRTHTAY